MYNNSSETVPLKMVVQLQAFLRPWFDKKCLQEALELIRAAIISFFIVLPLPGFLMVPKHCTYFLVPQRK